MYRNTTTVRVRYAETDQMGVVYYGNYAQYLEVGRVEAIRSLGCSYKQLEEQGIILPAGEMKIKYLRPAKYDEILHIITTIKELPIDSKIVFHSEIRNHNKQLLTIGEVTLYFLDLHSWEKTNMPTFLQKQLEPFFS